MSIDAAKYPQLAKMDDAQPSSQLIGEFLEWLSENGMLVGQHVVPEGRTTEVVVPISEGSDALLARYFGIDLNGVERERKQILEEWTKTQAAKAAA